MNHPTQAFGKIARPKIQVHPRRGARYVVQSSDGKERDGTAVRVRIRGRRDRALAAAAGKGCALRLRRPPRKGRRPGTDRCEHLAAAQTSIRFGARLRRRNRSPGRRTYTWTVGHRDCSINNLFRRSICFVTPLISWSRNVMWFFAFIFLLPNHPPKMKAMLFSSLWGDFFLFL